MPLKSFQQLDEFLLDHCAQHISELPQRRHLEIGDKVELIFYDTPKSDIKVEIFELVAQEPVTIGRGLFAQEYFANTFRNGTQIQRIWVNEKGNVVIMDRANGSPFGYRVVESRSLMYQ
ncbi:MAG TPA: hypothetical protein VK158_03375 [Acidobacteriota bacterium]|nr:hypothetical protein [Acidobacteriota bacterium]